MLRRQAKARRTVVPVVTMPSTLARGRTKFKPVDIFPSGVWGFTSRRAPYCGQSNEICVKVTRITISIVAGRVTGKGVTLLCSRYPN